MDHGPVCFLWLARSGGSPVVYLFSLLWHVCYGRDSIVSCCQLCMHSDGVGGVGGQATGSGGGLSEVGWDVI